MNKRNTCKVYPDCEEPVDKERNAGLCSEHTDAWLRSTEFRDAAKDEDVRFMMSLSKDMGMKIVHKRYRSKFIKRVQREQEL